MGGLDIFIAICIGIGLVKGLFDGIIKQVISLLALLLAILFAGKGAIFMREYLSVFSIGNDKIPGYVLTPLCYIVAFSVIIWGFALLGKLIEDAVKLTPAASLNMLLGGLLGAFKMVVILSLIFTILTVFDYNSRILKQQIRNESVLFDKVRCVVPFLYPFVEKYLKENEFFQENNPLKNDPDELKHSGKKEKEVWI